MSLFLPLVGLQEEVAAGALSPVWDHESFRGRATKAQELDASEGLSKPQTTYLCTPEKSPTLQKPLLFGALGHR